MMNFANPAFPTNPWSQHSLAPYRRNPLSFSRYHVHLRHHRPPPTLSQTPPLLQPSPVSSATSTRKNHAHAYRSPHIVPRPVSTGSMPLTRPLAPAPTTRCSLTIRRVVSPSPSQPFIKKRMSASSTSSALSSLTPSCVCYPRVIETVAYAPFSPYARLLRSP